jgi:acid phosphatase class B
MKKETRPLSAHSTANELIMHMAFKFPPQSSTTFDIWNGAKLCALVAVAQTKKEIKRLSVDKEDYQKKVKFWEAVEDFIRNFSATDDYIKRDQIREITSNLLEGSHEN